MFNPWAINAIEEFLFYCCPECEDRHQSKELFFQHAFKRHPHSINYLLPFKAKKEEQEGWPEWLYSDSGEIEEDDKDEVKSAIQTQKSIKAENGSNDSTFDPSELCEVEEANDNHEEEEDFDDDSDYEIPIKRTKKLKTKSIKPKTEKVLKEEIIPCFMKDCTFTALRMKDILIHLGKLHQQVDPKTKTCLKCKKRIVGGNTGILYYHIKRHYEYIEFVCAQCGQSFENPYSLKHHEKQVHTEAKWNCDKCGVTLKYKESLETHIASVHEKVRYHCDKCEKSFAGLYKLKKHIETYHEGKSAKKFQCDKCDKVYTKQFGLTRHKENFHQGKRYECEKCRKSFTQKFHLKKHLKQDH